MDRCVRGALTGTLLVLSATCVADAGDPSAAARNYLQYCSGCHQVDGRGSAPNRVPTFVDSLGHFARTLTGRAFLIQVGGVAQSSLVDREIADLLNWLLATYDPKDLPADFARYAADEVKLQRSNRPADLSAVRQSIAQELAARGFAITRY